MGAEDRAEEVDVVVLGVGSGGEYAARRLGRAGLQVAAVEERLVGGECPFWGCTPSKLLIHAAREGRALPAAAARIREATHDWHDDGHVGPMEAEGVRVVRGHGRLDGPGRVRVSTEDGDLVLTGRRGVVLNTGTAPAVPPVPGLDGTPYWTNREVFEVEEAPDSLAVLGAGNIGCELAQAFARLGTRVTLLESAERILVPEEPEAAEAVTRVLREEGVEVRTRAEVARVEHDGSGFTLVTGTGDVRADHLLVATGRRPHLADVGLESVGLDPDSDTVAVDEHCRAAERLWAVGDITGHGAYTHMSLYQGRVAVHDILEQDGPPATYHAVSRVTFTDPEVAGVGLTEAQAREQGIAVVTGTADIDSSPRGWIDEATGVVKVVADAGSGVVVGASVVAPYGGEVLGLLSTAVHARLTVPTLRGMHFAYPTFHRVVERALRDTGL
ncbi:NAD(P)/FAD-dependent oxidoreductase [uncultured Nocardioides sp.]|uniref:dihydrolipoyl dehydrogenase family protein n=1 Tax=uncultured Nocardioides sp. TaxID=198441 RepID=UPI00260DC4F2|nr:NAD(P)/FAD-dependent oxidoreductase [uncultured Nocardioides sp.]